MKKTHIIAAGSLLAIIGVGIAVTTSQQEEQASNTSALRNAFAQQAQLPVAQGPALLVVSFDPDMAKKTLFELASTKSNHIPDSTTLELRNSVLPATAQNPQQIVLITAYYDADDQKNNAALASYRAQMLANELSGLGLAENRISLSTPVALSGANLPDVNKVEVRLQ